MSDETSITIASYDQNASKFAANQVKALLTKELDLFTGLLPPRAWVVDAGSGPGQYTLALAARGIRVIALDLSVGLLRIAQSAGLDNLVLADMRELSFGISALDGIWACASLLHLPKQNMPDALVELRRVIRPGGAMYVGVKLGHGEEWISDPQGGRCFFAYYQPDELDTRLTAAGWRIVEAYTNADAAGRPIQWLNRICLAV